MCECVYSFLAVNVTVNALVRVPHYIEKKP